MQRERGNLIKAVNYFQIEGECHKFVTVYCLFQFEYQQAQLEAEVENLSWKVERAEITDRGVRKLLGEIGSTDIIMQTM